MLEIIEGLPDNVLGIVAKGRVTRKDCSEVLLPALESALEWHHKLRLYYEIRSRYPGAAWEEFTLGNEQARLWERVAVVSDAAWIRHTLLAVRLLIPSEIRVFATTQIPEGLAWITGAPTQRRRSAAARGPRHNGSGEIQPPVQYLHHGFRAPL
ncbi:MAG TPA: STAS/SEC14 domain-containing protein [Stellaceae bacterium]|nr:STAS/SEC14 domain-containing protein [Stellaceae bacterium]